jgi:hypothetical protein
LSRFFFTNGEIDAHGFLKKKMDLDGFITEIFLNRSDKKKITVIRQKDYTDVHL